MLMDSRGVIEPARASQATTPAAWVRACFHTFVFAAYPILLVTGANAGVVPLAPVVVVRALIISAAFTAVLLLLLRRAIPDLPSRAACLSFMFIAGSLYAVVSGTSTHAGFAALYVLASAVVAVAIVRPWRSRPRSSTAWNLAACGLLAVNLYGIAPAMRAREPWRPAADALIGDVVGSAGAAEPGAGTRRDIYYVVLDGFGRPDLLKELYALDLGWFVKALESRGFQVPSAGQSNYAQTFLSLASSLNLSYLDPVADTMRESADRRALDYLIQHNAMTTIAKRAGYRVIAVGSDYAATEWLENVDQCRCEQYGLHEIEVAAINVTPFRALLPNRWTYDAHRRKVEESFRELQYAADESGPKLVFGHVLAPHPPFVFESDGRPRSNGRRMFSFTDGSQYFGAKPEYISGYRNQAQFVAARVLALVDAMLGRPGPSPVIVLHGDHGPGSTWDWDHLTGANARERMGIFSAYRLPGENPPALPAHVTPVNVLRAVANRQLGTALAPLPDLSFASTWKRPYQFLQVQNEHQHAGNARPTW
jgi:hypothetical protein